MIRNPDFDSFVCCAFCSKIISPPPSPATSDRIREYKPFKIRYYTHQDILGKFLKSFPCKLRFRNTQKAADTHTEDAVEKALKEAAANHNAFVQDLKQKHGKELREAVRKAKTEMQQSMADEQKREVEAVEQRMAHRLQRALLECAHKKVQTIAEARRQEREAPLNETARQQRLKHILFLNANITNLTKDPKVLFFMTDLLKKSGDEYCPGIIQRKNQCETEKQLREAETLHHQELEKVMITLEAAEDQVKTLIQKLEKMTAWKDSLETEIQATRQAFQKYIDATFPNLSPGQADFILPLRKAFQQKDTPKEAESDKEYKRAGT
uniref:Chromosome 6 open reading frame 163 n=1 Tax=Apteryx owenii TaxID=8824 RepID=A0A8B9QNX7_APTOW